MSTCAEGTRKEDYDLSLHVGALFIILGVSAGACALPVLATRIPQLRIPARVLFVFRHFGTGVLIATAFVHLFPTAFVNLTNPCLPAFFNETYPALAGAIALAAVFIITVAEMIFSPGRSLCSGPEMENLTTDIPRSSLVLGPAEVGAPGLGMYFLQETHCTTRFADAPTQPQHLLMRQGLVEKVVCYRRPQSQ
jgi:zinc transporter ZupT